MKTLTIQLFGKAYKVKCPPGMEPVLTRSEALLNQKIEETKVNSGLTSREDLIMMTALNLCRERVEHALAVRKKREAKAASKTAQVPDGTKPEE